MKRGPKRSALVLVPAVEVAAEWAVEAGSATAIAAAGDTPGSDANPAGKLAVWTGRVTRPAAMKFWGGILWLVDQAQHSKNGRKSWLARISSVKRQPSGNSASSISCSSDRTMEFTLPKKIPLPPTWIWTETPPRSARSRKATLRFQPPIAPPTYLPA